MSVYCYFPHSHFFFLTKKWTLLTAAIQTIGKSEYYNLWLQKPWIAIFRQNDPNGILHLRRMGSPESCCFGGCHEEAAPQRCSWMKVQGASAPWGEETQAGGRAGWLQASKTLGLPGSWWKKATPSCAAPTAMGTWRLPQTQQTHFPNCAGRPHVSTVYSWVTAHTYFSRVSNGNKCVSLWLDVTYEGARVSASSASHCCGASQGYAKNYLPWNVQLQLSKKFSGTSDLLYKLEIFSLALEGYLEKDSLGRMDETHPMATWLLLLRSLSPGQVAGSEPQEGWCTAVTLYHGAPCLGSRLLMESRGGGENLIETLTRQK